MNPNINTINNFQQREGGQDVSCKDRIKQAWSLVPLFVRFVMITTVVLYILSWIVGVDQILTNIPRKTIYYFQLWRLVTSVFMTTSIFNIFFAFFSWTSDAIRLEQTSGTVRYALNFLVNSFLIQVLYTLALFIISLMAGQGALSAPSSGLWPLILAEITILCLFNPDNQVMMFFIPYPFRAIYYPWVLFGFFTLLNFTIQFDILAGIGYGYLFFYYLKTKIQFSDNFIQKCENIFIFKALSKLTSFVPLQSSTLNFSFNTSPTNRNNNNTSPQFKMEPTSNQPVSTPFKGKGTVVGNNFIYLNLQ